MHQASKRKRVDPVSNEVVVFDTEWVSPSSFRNYFLEDTLLDWLRYYGKYYNNDKVEDLTTLPTSDKTDIRSSTVTAKNTVVSTNNNNLPIGDDEISTTTVSVKPSSTLSSVISSLLARVTYTKQDIKDAIVHLAQKLGELIDVPSYDLTTDSSDVTNSSSPSPSPIHQLTSGAPNIPNTNQSDSSVITMDNYLKQKGNEFESAVIKHLMSSFSFKIVTVCEKNAYPDYNLYLRTCQLIKDQAEIIYQGVLCDEEGKTFGCPDLLIREDVFVKLFPKVDDCDDSIGTPHTYRVVEIKYTTVSLRADGIHILNYAPMCYYKAQTILYNKMLQRMTKRLFATRKLPKVNCYILGRGYKYKHKKDHVVINNGLSYLGTIDPYAIDLDYVSRIRDAIEWVRNVRANGSKWQVLPKPSIPELYPNMNNKRSGPWHKVKEHIADTLADITQICHCGPKHRRTGFDNGVYSWKDKRCSAKILGIGGNVIPKIIDNIIQFNRDTADTFTGSIDETTSWLVQSTTDYFIDMEFITNVFDDLSSMPYKNTSTIVFLFGILSADGEYTPIYCKQLGVASEKQLVLDVLEYFADKGMVRLFHWNHTEKTMFSALCQKYGLQVPRSWQFIDLLQVVKSNSILVRGVYNFGLKQYVKGLTNYHLINLPNGKTIGRLDVSLEANDDSCEAVEVLSDSEELSIEPKSKLVATGVVANHPVTNGIDAMLQSYLCYNNSARTLSDMHGFEKIIEYNNTDCIYVKGVLKFIRDTIPRKR
jgi:hypothetical protein